MSTAIRPVSRRRAPAPTPTLPPPPTEAPTTDLTSEQSRVLRAVYDIILAHAQPAGTP